MVDGKNVGKKFVYKGSLASWWGRLAGCLFIGTSLLGLLFMLNDGDTGRGGHIAIWGNLILLPIGITFTAFSIYALITGKGKPTYTDEEVAQAEAEMDAMYLREHGELPEKPKPEPEKPELEKPKKDTK